MDLNRVHLEELAAERGIDPLFLERDLVLTEIIWRYTQHDVGAQLVLKGGQALRHIYGSVRVSGDIDYVSARRVDFDELRDALIIKHRTLSIRVPDEPAGVTGRSVKVSPIEYRGPMGIPGKVEVDVSYRDDLYFPADVVPFNSPYRDVFEVQAMQIDEMVAEKVRALTQRGHPRDLKALIAASFS